MGSLLLVAAIAAGQPQPAPDHFVAVSPAAERPVGPLLQVTPDGTAELGGLTGPVVVRDVVSLRRVGFPVPGFPRSPGLLTTTGDRIPGRLVGGDAQAIRFHPAGAREPWVVPVQAISLLEFTVLPADTPPDPDRVSWLGANRKRDILRLRNGDIAPGTVVGFAEDGDVIRFKPDAGEERAVPLAAAGALALNPALASARRPKGAYSRIVLRDGTRLHLAAVSADATTVRGKTLFGQPVELAVSDIVALDTVRGKATDLSALKPRVEQSGFLGVAWPWAADRTVRGEPLRLMTDAGVETFDSGLGTHPRTTLTFELGGTYRRFEALAGLDPVTGRQGRAVVRVSVDGKDQALPGLFDLVPGPAVPVRVDLSGAKQLTLAVEPGPAGDVQADVNWADARLFE
ncbi:MAG TPA: NPCBM/NEW2 domain-containing protein [Urbifossiella sp.]|nr:NPCBM/NEW2 domain-containing protein [Urbifossiella sp.]